MEFVAFWLAVGAVIVVGALNSRRKMELRHETIRLMLEKGEKVDSAVLEGLLKPSDPYKSTSTPGDGYKAMRIIGTLLLFLAPGVALLMILAGYAEANQKVQVVGIAVGALLALIGTGLHVASRYVAPSQAQG